jgi:hypothetical protein
VQCNLSSFLQGKKNKKKERSNPRKERGKNKERKRFRAEH